MFGVGEPSARSLRPDQRERRTCPTCAIFVSAEPYYSAKIDDQIRQRKPAHGQIMLGPVSWSSTGRGRRGGIRDSSLAGARRSPVNGRRRQAPCSGEFTWRQSLQGMARVVSGLE